MKIINEIVLNSNKYTILEFKEQSDYNKYNHILKFDERLCHYEKNFIYYVCFTKKYLNFIFSVNIGNVMDDGHRFIEFYMGLNNNKNHKINLNNYESIKIATNYILNKYKVKFVYVVLDKKLDLNIQKDFIKAGFIFDEDETFNDRRFHYIKNTERMLIYYNNKYYS
jgi:hypothetical protein